MDSTQPQTHERTLYEARLDAECYAVCHRLHERMWRRFRSAVRVAVYVSGSAAFSGWLAVRPELAGFAGLILAILVGLEQAFDPSERIATHALCAQRYADLKRESLGGEMPLAAFDSRLESIKGSDTPVIDALLVCAFNRVVVAAGRADYRLNMSALQRLLAFIA